MNERAKMRCHFPNTGYTVPKLLQYEIETQCMNKSVWVRAANYALSMNFSNQFRLYCFFFLYYSISAWLKTFHTREKRKTHTSNALFKAYTSSINSNVYGRSNVISCNFESIGFVLWIIDRIKCTAPVTRRQFQMNFKYSRSIVVQVSS